MAVLNEKQRIASATVGKDRYPVNDKGHAKMALAYINKGGLSREQKMAVIKKAHAMLAR